jgi:hypothetical protein
MFQSATFNPLEQGGLIMKNKFKSGGVFFLAGLLIFAFPIIFKDGKVWAACPTPTTCANGTDTDQDGFCGNETNLTLMNSTTTITLNPNVRDVFVVIKRAPSGSLLTTYTDQQLMAYVTDPTNGLPLVFHMVTPAQIIDDLSLSCDRLVVQGMAQKAIRIVESLDTNDPTIMGNSSTGTPNGDDSATIYTKNISTVLNAAGVTLNSATGLQYLQHTIAHEIGHMVGPLAAVTYNAKIGGYHYTPGSGYVMDQSVQYKSSKWTIGNKFPSADKNGIKLIP